MFSENHDFFPENKDVQTFAKREVLDLGVIICEDGFKNPEFQKLIADEVQFDLIINEIPFYQYSAAGLSYIFNTPMVAVNSHGFTNLEEEFSGNPTFLPYVPDLSLPYGSRMTFIQRFHNTWNKIYWNIYNYIYNLPRHEKLLKKFFKRHQNLPALTEMLKTISLYIINSHPCINPRPYAPTTIEVGGIHLISSDDEKLPQVSNNVFYQ